MVPLFKLDDNITLAFSIIKAINQSCIPYIVANHSIVEYTNTLVSFCRTSNPKISLQAVDLLKSCYTIVESKKSSFTNYDHSITIRALGIDVIPQLIQFHYPILVSMHKVVIGCELEVRSR
jgi:hypothetical protein